MKYKSYILKTAWMENITSESILIELGIKRLADQYKKEKQTGILWSHQTALKSRKDDSRRENAR